MEMCVKVKNVLQIIILISVLNIHSNEATKLFNITEDAVSTGREILRVVEKVPNETNLNRINLTIFNRTEVTETMCEIIHKFHLRRNKPLKSPILVISLYGKLNSETLKGYYDKFIYKEFVAVRLEFINQQCADERFTLDPLHFILDENAFDLRKLEQAQEIVYNLHNLLLKEDPDTGDNIMNVLANQPSTCVWWSNNRQQIFNNLLDYITTIDAFYYVLTQVNYATFKIRQDALDKLDPKDILKLKLIESGKNTWTEKNTIERMKKLEKDFIERNTKTMNRFIDATAGQSREVWFCADAVSKGRFTKLENLFQMIIINEVNLNKDGTCKKECKDYYQTKQHGCYEGGICNHQRSCNGIVWDCGTKIDSPINICREDVNNANARYKSVSTEDITYGHDSDCNNGRISAKNWHRGFYKCSYCTCTCEELISDGDRYFNLRPVQSDIDSNYVITNAQFSKVNHIVHIQIEQGRLLSNGYIQQSSIKWKNVENFTIYDDNVTEDDIHTINWNKRKVYLGDADSPQHFVLTGLRIVSVSDGIKLEIGSTPYNITTGKLSNTIKWTSHADVANEWSELKFENKDEIITNNKAKYVKFEPNDLEIDSGQSTIPYLDTEEVVYNYRLPFSGAGLFTKNRENVGSILALKFLYYDSLVNMKEI